jgi:hypothetical protein
MVVVRVKAPEEDIQLLHGVSLLRVIKLVKRIKNQML